MLNVYLQSDPSLPLLSIHPEEIKAYVYAKTSAWMIIAALSVVAKSWEATQMPTNSWVVKQIMIYMCNKILLSNLKEGFTYTYNNMDESQNN